MDFLLIEWFLWVLVEIGEEVLEKKMKRFKIYDNISNEKFWFKKKNIVWVFGLGDLKIL